MKLSDWAALNLASDIVEEFEEWENSDPPSDYDEEKTANDDERFVDSIDDYEYQKKWPWYNRTVPDDILEILKGIRDDSFFNIPEIPGLDKILGDLYARNFYNLYNQFRKPKEYLSDLADQYLKLTDFVSDENKFLMFNINSEDYNSYEYADTFSWALVRGATYPINKVWEYDLKELDEFYLEKLISKIKFNESQD
jgi:hypothetical protein|tara:strand:+ start:630 stop:1217 length:588 start_codon:yes stop_codon:yes gene_type:complete